MQVEVDCRHELALELALAPGGGEALYVEPLREDLGELVDEAFVSGVLAERLPPEPDRLAVAIRAVWAVEPEVARIELELECEVNGARAGYTQRFSSGRWDRRAPWLVRELRSRGALPPDAPLVARLIATDAARVPPPISPLQAPPIERRTLEGLGVRRLGEGEIDPDRPVLAAERLVEEILAACERSGASETGGAVLGCVARLDEPLPGATTRVVTLLGACVLDERHAGRPGELRFSPEALADAARIAELRGRGEVVSSAFHTHGWGCGECNRSEACPLPECTLVSDDDYRVLESLFPGKATLLPIAGRRLGAPGRRPVLEIHAWRGGRVRPIRWRRFDD